MSYVRVYFHTYRWILLSDLLRCAIKKKRRGPIFDSAVTLSNSHALDIFGAIVAITLPSSPTLKVSLPTSPTSVVALETYWLHDTNISQHAINIESSDSRSESLFNSSVSALPQLHPSETDSRQFRAKSVLASDSNNGLCACEPRAATSSPKPSVSRTSLQPWAPGCWARLLHFGLADQVKQGV